MPSDSARQNATARGIEPGIDPFLPVMGDIEQFRAPKLHGRRVPRFRGPAAALGKATPTGAGRRTGAEVGEGVAGARQSSDVAMRQARAPGMLGFENGTRRGRRERTGS